MPRKSGSEGQGWGGPAKGAGIVSPRTKFTPGNKAAVNHGRPTAIVMESKRALEAERSQELKDHLYSLATKAEREDTQVKAAEAWLNRHEGMPVARNVNLNFNEVSNLSDADLDAEIVRLASRAGSTGGDAEGEAPARLPEGPADLVH